MKSGKLLGAHIAGAASVVAEATLAIQRGRDLFSHAPTLSGGSRGYRFAGTSLSILPAQS
ncbi:MAG: hypothetical protein ACLTTU_04380 [Bilophila wadsworthia]